MIYFLKKTKQIIFNIRNYCFCKIKIGSHNKTWTFHGLPIIRKAKNSTITIGKDFVACSIPRKNSISIIQKVFLCTEKSNSQILIGENVGISGVTISALSTIKIGNNVMLGSGVLITDNDSHPINFSDRYDKAKIKALPITIEDNVFIGARSIILKGVTIGKGSVIGAGSVVTKNIKANTIAVGNPAVAIKLIDQ